MLMFWNLEARVTELYGYAPNAYQPPLLSETRPTVHAFIFWRGMKEAGRGERPMRDPAAIDYWIRRHAIQVSCGPHPACGTDPAQHQRMFNPARDRMVGLSAIGQSLKDHYDALAPPMPPHLATLIEQLKIQK